MARIPTGLSELLGTLPQVGRVTWIGLRPARREEMAAVERVEVAIGSGLVGDRFQGRPESRRQVTLIQAEHLQAVAGLLGRTEAIDPSMLRRNIAVAGINLLALKERRFRMGGVLLEWTGQCHPCSRMEETLGPGGYNAMRGHGGITARVVSPGIVHVGDAVAVALDA